MSRQWDWTSGALHVRKWEGPSSGLQDFILYELPGGWHRFEIEDDTEFAEIVVSYASSGTDGVGSEASDGLVQLWWELDGNDIEKSIWEHPKVVARTKEYSVSQMASLREYFETVMDGTATSSWADPLGGSPENTDVNSAMLLLARGVESFTVSQYVLRKSQVVRQGTSLKASHSNINKIFSYAALTAAEPTLASYHLVDAPGVNTLKWLKRTPDVRPAQNGMFEITIEYWGADSWEPLLYDTVPDPTP